MKPSSKSMKLFWPKMRFGYPLDSGLEPSGYKESAFEGDFIHTAGYSRNGVEDTVVCYRIVGHRRGLCQFVFNVFMWPHISMSYHIVLREYFTISAVSRETLHFLCFAKLIPVFIRL